MSTEDPLRKAMIVIAVSDYKGGYPALHGTVPSAKRLANWAAQTEPGRGYSVLEITDENGIDVTVDRLRSEIKTFLASRLIDRLVVYFAGHGLVRSTADQYWLLTNAAYDHGEGVDMNGFKLGLTQIGIGQSNKDLSAGQLCFIVDACRNTATQATYFQGNAIITQAGRSDRMQVDLFFATALGQYAYAVGASAGAPHCLFSSVLSDALEGNIPDVVEETHHPFSPAIVNNLLADYLDKEVPKRARQLGQSMTPDTNTGIRTPLNYYDLLQAPLPESRPLSPPSSDPMKMTIPELASRIDLEFHKMSTGKTTVFEERTEEFRAALRRTNTIFSRLRSRSRQYSRIIIEASPAVAIPRGAFEVLERIDDGWIYGAPPHRYRNDPIFARRGDGWILAPLVDFTDTMLPAAFPGDVLLRSDFPADPHIMPFGPWDTSLSATAALVTPMPLRISDAVHLADTIRYGKARHPNHANIAGYLYDFVDDGDNARRTAHFMVEDSTLPIDLALVAGENLRWYQSEEDGWEVRADLPAVEATKEGEPRPWFTTTAFESKANVRVHGILPIHRRGWFRLAATHSRTLPFNVTEIVESMAGGSAVTLPDFAMRMIVEFFGYSVVEAKPRLVPWPN